MGSLVPLFENRKKCYYAISLHPKAYQLDGYHLDMNGTQGLKECPAG